MLLSLALGLGLVLLLVAVRLVASLPRCRRRRRLAGPASVLVVFGSGGHTGEMLGLLAALPSDRYRPTTFLVADTDTTSEPQAKAKGVRGSLALSAPAALSSAAGAHAHPAPRVPPLQVVPQTAAFVRIPRSREVGQRYAAAILPTLRAFARSLQIVWAARPDIILVNGPGTCLPVCLAGFLLRVCGLADPSIVFVESVCRVTSLSATGKLLYHLADQVQVQWPELAARYPRATYVGMLA